MSIKACTICAGKLKYGNPEKDCFRCNGTGKVAAQWEEPADPPFDLIRSTAYDLGYAVATHGTLMRDYDIIAVPWTAEASGTRRLLDVLCKTLNAKIVQRESKPHGRNAFSLQMDAFVKVIDISITPTLRDAPSFPHYFRRGGRVGDG